MLKKTLVADAKHIGPIIKLDDVNEFFNKYVEQQKQAHGANSCVANGSKYEYQVNLFHHTS